MQELIDFSLLPSDLMALDEAMLDAAEQGRVGPLIYFWESPAPFVVLGYSNQLNTETHPVVCAEKGVPILRRCSGGGTVLQGPGCFNYAVVHPITEETSSITATNQFVMERQRVSMERASGLPVEIRGFTDLVTQGRKFSGNAQRRKKSWFLFHGTVLLDAPLEMICACLAHPTKEPDYRDGRCHSDFLGSLPVDQAALRSTLLETWECSETIVSRWHPEVRALVESRYGTPEFIQRF